MDPMPFYSATALAVIAAEVFGQPWHDVSDDARRVLLADIEAVDAEREEPSPRWATRELCRRIGGAQNLASYASTLLAGEQRRNRCPHCFGDHDGCTAATPRCSASVAADPRS